MSKQSAVALALAESEPKLDGDGAPARSLQRMEHVELSSGDPAALASWYCEVLGLAELDRDGDTVYLTCGGQPGYSVAISPGGTGMRAVAASIDSVDRLEWLAGRFPSGAEVESDPAPGTEARTRLELPTGHLLDVIVRGERQGYLFAAEWEPSAAAGAPNEFNHVGIATDDLPGLRAFLIEHLRLRTSDVIVDDEDVILGAFMRITANHHDLSIFQHPQNALHHLAFSVPDVGTLVGFADRLCRFGFAPDSGIGRHAPGNNIYIYVRDRDENRVEISTQLAMVTDQNAPIRVWRNSPMIFNAWAQKSTGPPPSHFEHVT